MAESLLVARDLHAGYGDVQILWGVDIEVPAGSIVSLIGPNGAGKTTLLMSLCGILSPRRGEVLFNGAPIARLGPAAAVDAGIAHVPEGRRLFRTMSVRDNLLMGAYHRRDAAAIRRDLDFVFGLFPVLRERAGQDATTLSGGQQQMCAIGRGLMARPKLLMIDELSLGLAPRAVEELAASLALVNDEGITILLVEQDVMTAFDIADYGYVIESGRIAMHGQTAELRDDPQLQHAYMGLQSGDTP